ncbi:MAG: hypothetical protein HRU22_09890 [Gammaproteobacteria bacterium]|nr:hypothetical protein [Gammaproteobacteria bacterium]
MDNQTIYRSKKTIRAAFAQILSKRLDFPLADAKLALGGHLVGQPHLTMVNYGTLGYPMTDSLLPIAKMLNGELAQAEHITRLDELMDDTNADLHDRILNISPPFHHEVNLNFNAPILNRVYEDMLRTSSFAGRVIIDDAQLQQVQQFLYPTDQQGGSTKSSAYLLYEQYENKISQLNVDLHQARIADDLKLIKFLHAKILRLDSEWHHVGQKNKIEQMIALVIAGDKDANFEDERVHFIAILASRKQGRLTSALEYAKVKIHPLSPLIDHGNHRGWTDIVLKKDQLLAALSPQVKQLFKLSTDDINHVIDRITTARLSYLVVMLNREWLCVDFLKARYWRSNKQMSDGIGGGLAPTVATYAIFVKQAAFFYQNGISADEKIIKKTDISVPRVTVASTGNMAKLLGFISKTLRISRPTQSTNKAEKNLIVKGDIELSPQVTIDEIKLNLYLFDHATLLEKRPIALVKTDQHHYHFDVELTSRFVQNKSGQPLGQQIVNILNISKLLIRLTNVTGEVLIEEAVEFNHANLNLAISWQVDRNAPSQVDMSSTNVPLLMSYAIEILPKAPNPSAHYF